MFPTQSLFFSLQNNQAKWRSIRNATDEDRLRCLVVYGIPKSENTTAEKYIMTLGTKIGCNLVSTDIEDVLRITPTVTIVKFSDMAKRNENYKAKGILRQKSITSETLGHYGKGKAEDIYINEYLSQETYKLYRECRNKGKGLYTCYTKQCEIYMREKKSGSVPKKIASQEDLAALLNTNKGTA